MGIIHASSKGTQISFLTSCQANPVFLGIQEVRDFVRELTADKDSEVRNFALSLSHIHNIN
jgi:hypothetical protein